MPSSPTVTQHSLEVRALFPVACKRASVEESEQTCFDPLLLELSRDRHDVSRADDCTKLLTNDSSVLVLSTFEHGYCDHLDPWSLDEMGHPVKKVGCNLRVATRQSGPDVICHNLDSFVVLHGHILCYRRPSVEVERAWCADSGVRVEHDRVILPAVSIIRPDGHRCSGLIVTHHPESVPFICRPRIPLVAQHKLDVPVCVYSLFDHDRGATDTSDGTHPVVHVQNNSLVQYVPGSNVLFRVFTAARLVFHHGSPCDVEIIHHFVYHVLVQVVTNDWGGVLHHLAQHCHSSAQVVFFGPSNQTPECHATVAGVIHIVDLIDVMVGCSVGEVVKQCPALVVSTEYVGEGPSHLGPCVPAIVTPRSRWRQKRHQLLCCRTRM